MFGQTKYIQVGMGVSEAEDEAKAVEEAISQALKQVGGEPTFSFVYTSYTLDQEKIAKLVTAKLGSEWVGMSVDKHLNNKKVFSEKMSVSVLCIKSEYMQFSVAVAENVSKDPKEKAKKAIKTAVKNMHSKKALHGYVAFSRMKSGDYESLIDDKHFLTFTFVESTHIKNGKEESGAEIDFIEGLVDFLGVGVPIFGGGAGSDVNDLFYNSKGTNYQFGNGKVYTDAGVVVFCVTDLHFEMSIEHAYKLTDKFATVTKLSKDGYEILELNGKEAVLEYANLLGINKAKYLKDPAKYSLERPFGLVGMDGTTYIKEVILNADNKSFHSRQKTFENTLVNIMKLDQKEIETGFSNTIKKIKKVGKPAVVFVSSCATRRFLMGERITTIHAKNVKTAGSMPFFGGFVFSEIGQNRTSRPMAQSESLTSLAIYDKLL